MTVTLKWSPDPAAETHLQRINPMITWDLQEVNLSKIDRKWGLNNNARRSTALHPDVVLEYATAMSTGATFPAVVLRRLKGLQLLGPLSGNHRIASVAELVDWGDVEPANASILAYVLKTSDEMVMDIFARSANTLLGEKQSKDEALNHCCLLMTAYNLTAAQVASYFGIKESTLASELQARSARAVLAKTGISTEFLPKASVLKLAQLQYNEPTLRRATALTTEFKLNSARVTALTDELRAATSEQAATDVLARWREQLGKERKPTTTTGGSAPAPIVRKKRTRLAMLVNDLHQYLMKGNKGGKPFMNLKEMQITDQHDRSEIHDKWREAKKHLDTLFHAAQR